MLERVAQLEKSGLLMVIMQVLIRQNWTRCPDLVFTLRGQSNEMMVDFKAVKKIPKFWDVLIGSKCYIAVAARDVDDFGKVHSCILTF